MRPMRTQALQPSKQADLNMPKNDSTQKLRELMLLTRGFYFLKNGKKQVALDPQDVSVVLMDDDGNEHVVSAFELFAAVDKSKLGN